jgi:hypothetical protein
VVLGSGNRLDSSRAMEYSEILVCEQITSFWILTLLILSRFPISISYLVSAYNQLSPVSFCQPRVYLVSSACFGILCVAFHSYLVSIVSIAPSPLALRALPSLPALSFCSPTLIQGIQVLRRGSRAHILYDSCTNRSAASKRPKWYIKFNRNMELYSPV